MSDILLEVSVGDNGLPGRSWTIPHRDPRYLFAIVYALKKGKVPPTPGADKFKATLENGYVILEMPRIDGEQEMFVSVLIQTIECIARVITELNWGAQFFAQAAAQPKIATPKLPGGFPL